MRLHKVLRLKFMFGKTSLVNRGISRILTQRSLASCREARLANYQTHSPERPTLRPTVFRFAVGAHLPLALLSLSQLSDDFR